MTNDERGSAVGGKPIFAATVRLREMNDMLVRVPQVWCRGDGLVFDVDATPECPHIERSGKLPAHIDKEPTYA